MDMDIVTCVRTLKSRYINGYGEVMLTNLIEFIRLVEKEHYESLFDTLLEDDFDRVLLLRLRNVLNGPQEIVHVLLTLIMACTDRSVRVCERLCSHEEFHPMIITLIKRSDLDEEVKFDLVCIINNITFNYDDSIFGDSDVKIFLIRMANNLYGCYCVVILVRLCNEEELVQFQDIICTFVPKIVILLKQCCLSFNFKYEYTNLEEVLKYVDTLSKCSTSKETLARDLNFLFQLRHILIEDRFAPFVNQTKQLLVKVYNEKQVEDILNETGHSS